MNRELETTASATIPFGVCLQVLVVVTVMMTVQVQDPVGPPVLAPLVSQESQAKRVGGPASPGAHGRLPPLHPCSSSCPSHPRHPVVGALLLAVRPGPKNGAF